MTHFAFSCDFDRDIQHSGSLLTVKMYVDHSCIKLIFFTVQRFDKIGVICHLISDENIDLQRSSYFQNLEPKCLLCFDSLKLQP